MATHFPSLGRRLNGFLGLSLDDGTILFLVILLDSQIRQYALRRLPLPSFRPRRACIFLAKLDKGLWALRLSREKGCCREGETWRVEACNGITCMGASMYDVRTGGGMYQEMHQICGQTE